MKVSIYLGTSIARPLIAKRQIAIAKKFKAFAVLMELQEKVMIKLDLNLVMLILVKKN